MHVAEGRSAVGTALRLLILRLCWAAGGKHSSPGLSAAVRGRKRLLPFIQHGLFISGLAMFALELLQPLKHESKVFCENTESSRAAGAAKWHGAGEALVRRHGNRDSHGEPEHPLLSVGFQSSSLASWGKQQNLLPGPCAADAPSKASKGCLGATTRAWTHPADSSSVLVGWEGNARVPEAITDLETLLRAARNRYEHRSPSAQPHVKSRLTEL